MDKKIYTNKEVREKVMRGVDTISDPVKQTLSPRGRNILFKMNGSPVLTNDGVTIAKNINVHDPIEDSIIDIIKGGALKTNLEAGDGTTTTILMSQLLIKEGIKLVDNGRSWIEVRDMFLDMEQKFLKRIDISKMTISSEADKKNIAKISANNDAEIAEDIVEVIKIAGHDGMVFLEPNNKTKTELIKDLGFMVKTGLLYQELLIDPSIPVITMKDVPVFITDKRIYYPEEAETIMRTAVQAGYSELVIVARDFMGEAVNSLITNHKKGVIKLMLVKDDQCTEKDNSSIQDLAMYLGGKVITDKEGSIVNKITEKDFILVNKVFMDENKTLFTPKKGASKELKAKIKYLKGELDKDKEDGKLKRRISSLTNGVVTVKIGGNTPLEVKERIFRYEDAVNATRSAMRDGYLVGGGLSFLNAYNPSDYSGDIVPIAKKFGEVVVRQIAENCGKHTDSVMENIQGSKNKYYGYNALTDSYEDLLKARIIDPYMVVKMSIRNSISVANVIISIGYHVVDDLTNYDKETKDNGGN